MKYTPKERRNLLALLAVPMILTILLTFPNYQAFQAAVTSFP